MCTSFLLVHRHPFFLKKVSSFGNGFSDRKGENCLCFGRGGSEGRRRKRRRRRSRIEVEELFVTKSSHQDIKKFIRTL